MSPTAVRPAAVCAESSADSPVILFVSDDADLRQVAVRVLQWEGYRVLPAPHAGHALLACLEAERVDAAVVELSMEDMSGPALVRRLRRHNPDLRAIFLGQAGTSDCDGILARPFTSEDLLSELDSVLTPVC